MTQLSRAVLVGSLAGLLGLAACGGSGTAESEGEEAGLATEVVEAPPLAREVVRRGVAIARREADFIVTSFRIRNQAENAIAGFQVDEFWFDVDGNTVTGDRVRFREPLLTGQVVDIELRVPRHPAMDSSNYEFSHQNGDILATLLDDIPAPEEEEEEGEEEGAETDPADR